MNQLIKLPKGVKADAVCLELQPQMGFEDWLEVGATLGRWQGSLQWLIGDWWNYGEHAYGEKIQSVRGVEGLPSHKTCRNYGSVAKAFEMSRRRDIVPFAHHAELAGQDEETADALLDEAEANDWARRDLRKALKDLREDKDWSENTKVETSEEAESLYKTEGEPDPPEEPELLTAEQVMEVNATRIRSGCASLTKAFKSFVTEDLSEDLWVDDGRAQIALGFMKQACAVLRLAVGHGVCPACAGDGCEKCEKAGYLPKSEFHILSAQLERENNAQK